MSMQRFMLSVLCQECSVFTQSLSQNSGDKRTIVTLWVAFQKINLVSVFQLQFTISVVCAVVCLQHPKYVDALLRLAAMAHARNNISTSLDLVMMYSCFMSPVILLYWNKVFQLFTESTLTKTRPSLVVPVNLMQVSKALAINDKYLEGLSVRGNLELKADDWLKAKDTLKSILQITDGKDNYATLALVSSTIPCTCWVLSKTFCLTF